MNKREREALAEIVAEMRDGLCATHETSVFAQRLIGEFPSIDLEFDNCLQLSYRITHRLRNHMLEQIDAQWPILNAGHPDKPKLTEIYEYFRKIDETLFAATSDFYEELGYEGVSSWLLLDRGWQNDHTWIKCVSEYSDLYRVAGYRPAT